MPIMTLPLPRLSEADPTVSGEGSLDPLGMAQLADRLAESLLPGLRARMRRIRFLTVSAVGALAAEDVVDVLPVDRISTPSICFEWLVLEAFARRGGQDQPLLASGIPGSSKVRSVLAQGKRLAARNYLKSPNVFGFTGIYLPLARHLQVLDEDRRVAGRLSDLTQAWERDRGLEGYTDGRSSTTGGQLRRRLRDEIRAGLLQGHCAAPEGAHLWRTISESLHPTQAGRSEKSLLRRWIVDDKVPMRAELARFLDQQGDIDEADALRALLEGQRSLDLRVRLEAIAAYEAVAHLLDAAFKQLCYLSTTLGTRPLTTADVSRDRVLDEARAQLPYAVKRAAECLERIDSELLVMFNHRLGRFEQPGSAADFVDLLLAHHEAVQARKPPKGKRAWLDRHAGGWVVRSIHWQSDAAEIVPGTLVHPYRLRALRDFMKDLAP